MDELRILRAENERLLEENKSVNAANQRMRLYHEKTIAPLLVQNKKLTRDLERSILAQNEMRKSLDSDWVANFQENKTLRSRLQSMEHDWERGYVCAVANLMRSHGASTEARDVLMCLTTDRQAILKYGVEESDIEVIEPILTGEKRHE